MSGPHEDVPAFDPRLLAFERLGLGYVGRIKPHGIELRIDRLKGRDELHGTLTVERAGPGTLTKSRFNVSSATTRKSMATYLHGRSNSVDWTGILEVMCLKTMEAEERGEDVADVGAQTETRRSSLLIPPFLPLNMPTLLYADGGTGKSMLTLALGISIRTGRAIVPGISPRHTGQVVYLDWETDRWEADTRIKAICAGADIEPVSIRYLHCHRPLVEIVERVARECDEVDAALLIVDSVGLAQGSSGDGMDANDATLRYFDALRAIGRTSLSVDHVPKNGMGKPYGSAYKHNMARAGWEMKKTVGNGDGDTHTVLYHRKHNTTGELPPIGLVMQWSEESVTFHQEAVSAQGYGDAPETLTQADRIARAISMAGHPLEPKEIALLTDITEGAIRAQLSRHSQRFERRPGGWTVRD